MDSRTRLQVQPSNTEKKHDTLSTDSVAVNGDGPGIAAQTRPPTLGEKPCPQRPALQARPLLTDDQATELELLFRLLGNTTRLKILHCLVREGELNVGELCERIGLNTQAVSNQLRNLAGNGVVLARRCGTNIHYRVIDDCVLELLERGLCQRECVVERGESCGSEGCCNA